MKTKTAMTVVLMMALLMVPVLASGHRGRPDHAGPANKATGGIEVVEGESYAQVEFNAHEAKGNRLAKGMFKWQLMNEDGMVIRAIEVDVVYVLVEGENAWFAGFCTEDTDDALQGHWFFVRVYDGGTPAHRGDQIWWEWLGLDAEVDAIANVEEMADPANEKEIISGNLVVHIH